MYKNLCLSASLLILAACSPGETPASDQAGTVADTPPVAVEETVLMTSEALGEVCASTAAALEIEASDCRVIEQDGGPALKFEGADTAYAVNLAARDDVFTPAGLSLLPTLANGEPTFAALFMVTAPDVRPLCIEATGIAPGRGANALSLLRAGDVESAAFNIPFSDDGTPGTRRFDAAIAQAATENFVALLPREPGLEISEIRFLRCDREY